jgi:hypothetical protein
MAVSAGSTRTTTMTKKLLTLTTAALIGLSLAGGPALAHKRHGHGHGHGHYHKHCYWDWHYDGFVCEWHWY